ALSTHTLVRALLLVGPPPETLGGDLLKLLPGVHRHRMRRPRHRVRRLAAAGGTGPRQVLQRAAPQDVALLPRHAKDVCGDAMHVEHRSRPEIADARVDLNA